MNEQGVPFVNNVFILCTYVLSESMGLKESKRSGLTYKKALVLLVIQIQGTICHYQENTFP